VFAMVRTLRGRMLLLAVACVIGTLAVAGASLMVVFEKHVLELIGRDLDLRWSEIARHVTVDDNGEPQVLSVSLDSRYDAVGSGAYWELLKDGETKLLSSSLGGRALNLSDAGPEREAGKWFEIDTEDGHELYVVERTLGVGPPKAQRQFRLAVALDHAQVVDVRQAFVWDMVVVLGLISMVLVAAAGLQYRIILQPLDRLRKELGDIRDGRQARFRSVVPSEIAPFAEDLNRLLDGQERLVKKARERAGALAHGLKTPLAILLAEHRSLEASGEFEAARRIREQAVAIQTHIERELARARANGAATGLGSNVDASKTAERLVRVMSRMPRGEEIDWRCDAPEMLMIRMDPDDFGEILGNLLDNARKWAVGEVSVRCEAVGGSARVTVTDDGPGFGANASPSSLTAGDRESSAGLGLVIVQDILAAYGSCLWIDRAASRGVVSFQVSAPGSRPEQAELDRSGVEPASGWDIAADRRPG
jgi:signal transduction histidine kinase